MHPVSISLFENAVKEHSMCPGDLQYNALALAGEVGEVANIVKKIILTRINPDWVTQDIDPMHSEAHYRELLADELGDALFYLTRLIMDNQYSLIQIATKQRHKLEQQSEKYKKTFLK